MCVMYWEGYSGGFWGVETTRSPMEGEAHPHDQASRFLAACSRLALCLIARTLRLIFIELSCLVDVHIATLLLTPIFSRNGCVLAEMGLPAAGGPRRPLHGRAAAQKLSIFLSDAAARRGPLEASLAIRSALRISYLENSARGGRSLVQPPHAGRALAGRPDGFAPVTHHTHVTHTSDHKRRRAAEPNPPSRRS